MKFIASLYRLIFFYEQIAVDDQRAKIEKEIARLEKQARAEKQPKKKFELVQKIKELSDLI